MPMKHGKINIKARIFLIINSLDKRRDVKMQVNVMISSESKVEPDTELARC